MSERFARTLRDRRVLREAGRRQTWDGRLSPSHLELGLNCTSLVLCVLLGQVHAKWVFTRNRRREGAWVKDGLGMSCSL